MFVLPPTRLAFLPSPTPDGLSLGADHSAGRPHLLQLDCPNPGKGATSPVVPHQLCPLSGRLTAIAPGGLLSLVQSGCMVAGHRGPRHNSSARTKKRQETQKASLRGGDPSVEEQVTLCWDHVTKATHPASAACPHPSSTPLTPDNLLTWITHLTFAADQTTPTNRLAALPKGNAY